MPVVRLVVVAQILPAGVRVRLEVVIRPVGDALYLAPSPRIQILHVVSGFGVVRQLVRLVLADAQALAADAQIGVPVDAVLYPLFVRALILAGQDKILYLHHLKLARSEDEVAGGDFVSERLADLGDTERRALSGRCEDVGEVDEYPLRRLRAQIGFGRAVLRRPDGRLEHEVELPWRADIAFAVGFGAVVDAEVVFPEAPLAVAALDERVVEPRHMPARLPDLRAHENRRIQPHDVIAPPDERPPPRILDVLLQLRPQRPVVPGASQAAVNLAALKDEPAPLAKRDDALQIHFRRRMLQRNALP